MRRLVIAAAVGAAVVGTAVPSLAAQTPKGTLPVGATVRTDNGVFVGTTIFGQPGAAAGVGNGQACVGFSYEVPQCVGTPSVDEAIPGTITVGPASVTVSTANGGVAVGSSLGSQPLIGASVGNGWVCVGFSEEIPFCWPLNSTNGAAATPRQQLPGGGVVFYHDDTRTAVGVGDVGVIIYNDGRICPVVSTQNWRCIPADLA
jgi:hypothetical protein